MEGDQGKAYQALAVIPAIDLAAMRAELERDEGRRHDVYSDQFGNQTIGVGHKLSRTELPAGHWDDAKIDAVLDDDIGRAVADISGEDWFRACDTDARRRALVNMRFQLGGHGIREFVHSLALIRQKQWAAAADHLKESLWREQTPARADRVIAQIRNG